MKRTKIKEMSASIYFHSEIKINGQWHHHSVHNIYSDLALFELLGYECDAYGIKPICDFKGFPKDASFMTKFYYDRRECEDVSWLSSKEIEKMYEFIESEQDKMPSGRHGYFFKRWPSYFFDLLFGSSWGSFLKYPDDYEKEIEDIRFVYWFRY